MNVEVSVNLDKNGVYFAGETLSCEMTIRYAYQAVSSPLSPSSQHNIGSGGSILSSSASVRSSSTSIRSFLDGRSSITSAGNIRAPTRRSSLASQSGSSSILQTDTQSQVDTITPATSVATSPTPSIRESWASSRYSLDENATTHGKLNKAHEISHRTHASEGSIASTVSPSWPSSTRTTSRPTRLRSIAASVSTPTTQLLWGFAQVVGVFTIDETLIRSDAFASLNTRGMYQAMGVSGMVGGFGGGTLGITSAMGSGQSTIDTHPTDGRVKLPLFTTPPSILFTDITLSAGQEKTYQFQIKLPTSLPPSYRGRTIRFQYHINVGVQINDSTRPQYLAQVPFRIFNRVHVDGTCPKYDLLTPVAIGQDLAIICDKDSKLAAKKSTSIPSKAQSNGGRNRFLRAVFEAAKQEHEVRNGRQRAVSEVYLDEDGDGSSARHAMFTYQAARAVNFNLSMNDHRVAKLSLAKTTLRLGDTLRGVLDFSNASLACYHVSISLETMEVVAPGYARGNAEQVRRLSRRSHVEWHAYCHQLSRLGFSLAIPPELSPGFETNALSLVWSLRVELIVGKSTAIPLQHIVKQDGSRIYEAVAELNADTLNCSVPLQIYPCQPGSVHGYRTQQTFVVA